MRKNMCIRVLTFGLVLSLVAFCANEAFAQLISNQELEIRANKVGSDCRARGLYPDMRTGGCTGNYKEYEEGMIAVGLMEPDDEEDDDSYVGNVPEGDIKKAEPTAGNAQKTNDVTKNDQASSTASASTAGQNNTGKKEGDCKSWQVYDPTSGRCLNDPKKFEAEQKAILDEREASCAKRGLTYNSQLGMCTEKLEDSSIGEPDSEEPAAGSFENYGEALDELSTGTDADNGSTGGLQVKTTTKTITNEGETVETKTGDLASLGASGTEAAADAAATEQASQGAEEAAEKAKEEEKQEEEEKEDLSKYTGLYNDRHIMPDEMAKHCRITGEEVAKDPEKFIKCIKQYVSEMNNPNATAKAEAEREYEMLKYKFLTDAGATAINKSATVNNNEDVVNGISSAQGDGRTESDDNKGIMASILIATNVMNDVRELLVEQLKYDVVSGIGDIDPAIIMENEEPKEEKKDEEKSASGSEAKGPEYKVIEVEKKVENKSE